MSKTCAKCKHYITGKYTEKCGFGGKVVLTEIALRSGSRCGPERKAFEARLEAGASASMLSMLYTSDIASTALGAAEMHVLARVAANGLLPAISLRSAALLSLLTRGLVQFREFSDSDDIEVGLTPQGWKTLFDSFSDEVESL